MYCRREWQCSVRSSLTMVLLVTQHVPVMFLPEHSAEPASVCSGTGWTRCTRHRRRTRAQASSLRAPQWTPCICWPTSPTCPLITPLAPATSTSPTALCAPALAPLNSLTTAWFQDAACTAVLLFFSICSACSLPLCKGVDMLNLS